MRYQSRLMSNTERRMSFRTEMKIILTGFRGRSDRPTLSCYVTLPDDLSTSMKQKCSST